jgi:hypothetical protein
LLEDALSRAMGVVTFSDGVKEDGIHRDGSYLQHDGILCTFAQTNIGDTGPPASSSEGC